MKPDIMKPERDRIWGFAAKAERNKRVQARYDELMAEGKHGHYETLFRVVREELDAEREQCALIAENYPTVAPSSEFVVQTTMEVAALSIASTIRDAR
jgi:cytidylate kinase